MRFKDTVGISHYLRKTELKLKLKIDQVLNPLQLTLPKYSVLALLEEETKLTNAELARRSSVTPQTMNRILHSLQSDSLISSKSDNKSELKINYALTAKAKKIICSAHEAVNKIELEMIEGLSPKDFSQLMQLFEKMNKNLNGSDKI